MPDQQEPEDSVDRAVPSESNDVRDVNGLTPMS